jgi:hypothetical protein
MWTKIIMEPYQKIIWMKVAKVGNVILKMFQNKSKKIGKLNVLFSTTFFI